MPNPDPQAGSDVRLEATVDGLTFRSEDGNFAIVDLALDDGRRVRAKGPLAALHAGERVTVLGAWSDDHRWGRTLRVCAAWPRLPEAPAALARVLADLGVPGVGPATAARAVASLGSAPLQRLREDADVLRGVRGLAGDRGRALVAAVRARLDQVDQEAGLYDMGLGPSLVAAVQRRWPGDGLARLRADPYAALGQVRGYGFATADAVAARLGRGAEDPARVLAGVRHALVELARAGHSAPARLRAVDQATRLLGLAPDAAEQGLDAAVGRAEVVAYETDTARVVAVPALAADERGLAEAVRLRTQSTDDNVADAALAGRIASAQAALGVALAPEQAAAVAKAAQASLHVVTGGPGTGKTTIVRCILAAQAPGTRTLLAAPTGRAARRLTESTGFAATTLHRLLAFDPRNGRFGHDAADPLPADLVIVDEASMLDVPLAAALLRALAASTRLLLIGDVDQLPSVGPGAVLEDLLATPAVPRTVLRQVFRQGARSDIVTAAHAVLRGQVPHSSSHDHGEFYVLLRPDAAAVAATIEEVAARRLPRRFALDPREDIAVLVPMHRGPVGTRALNVQLGQLWNSSPPGGAATLRLRAGDKVVQTRNNHDLEVFNGETGTIERVDQAGLQVRIAGRLVIYPADAAHDLELAWAMTVHKAQGSEVQAVVIGLEDGHHLLLERSLLYTAITRARRVAVVVATPGALARAVANAAPRRRETLLAAWLAGHVRGPAGAPR